MRKISSVVGLTAVCVASVVGQEMLKREISRGAEREIHAVLDFSFGTLFLTRGPADKVMVIEYTYEGNKDEDLKIEYSVDHRTGQLLVRSKERSDFWKGKSDDEKTDRRWYVQLTDGVPLSLEIELGAGRGELDLTGLQVQSLDLSSGASTIEMYCDEPNPINADRIVIQSGVSKFEARDLCNTNFRKLKFSGGVGAYNLHFGGTLRKNADAVIEVGLGAITIEVPESTPVRIAYDDSWFSSFDLDDGFAELKKGVYETRGFGKKSERLFIEVESGFGSVRVKQRSR